MPRFVRNSWFDAFISDSRGHRHLSGGPRSRADGDLAVNIKVREKGYVKDAVRVSVTHNPTTGENRVFVTTKPSGSDDAYVIFDERYPGEPVKPPPDDSTETAPDEGAWL